MRFGQLDIDPAVNPAVLDTLTWDPERACRILGSIPTGYWRLIHALGRIAILVVMAIVPLRIEGILPSNRGLEARDTEEQERDALATKRPLPSHDRCVVYSGSVARQGGTAYALARLSDGQHVFLAFGGEDTVWACRYE